MAELKDVRLKVTVSKTLCEKVKNEAERLEMSEAQVVRNALVAYFAGGGAK